MTRFVNSSLPRQSRPSTESACVTHLGASFLFSWRRSVAHSPWLFFPEPGGERQERLLSRRRSVRFLPRGACWENPSSSGPIFGNPILTYAIRRPCEPHFHCYHRLASEVRKICHRSFAFIAAFPFAMERSRPLLPKGGFTLLHRDRVSKLLVSARHHNTTEHETRCVVDRVGHRFKLVSRVD